MKIRLWPTVLILIVVAITLRLGFWQRDRAHQKEALNAQIVAFEDLRDGFAHEGLGRALEPRCRRQRRQHLVIVTEPQTIVCEGRLDNTREVIADRLECRRDAVHTSILMEATDIQSPDQKVENGL